jgi:hypothetical protein
MSDEFVKSLVQRSNSAFRSTERNNQDQLWTLIAEYMLPNQSGIFLGAEAPGEKKTRRLFDSTAIQANHDLAAAVHATLTNPATQWSRLRYKDDSLNNNADAVAWLQDTNRRIHESLNESNFDTQASKNYQAFTSLGTMALFQEQSDPEMSGFSGFKFNAWHLSEVSFSEGLDGKVDTVFRKFKMTARQALERWGNKVSEDLQRVAEDKPDKEIEFLHVILPRKPEQVKLNDAGLAPPKSRPFASYYIERKADSIVEESGYYEFPCYITRWQTMPGEIYGRGPGHIALPDVRTLNKVKELGLHAINKAINPPILANQRGILGALDLRPNQLTVVKDINGIREMVPQARYDVTNFAVTDLRDSIKNIFFLDKLLLPPRTETGEMTAFEVQQRAEQMQRVFGPTLSRLNSEFLTPLIIRSFKMMLRGGALAQLPPILQEQGISVDIAFVNPLARSQQIEDVGSIQQWVQNIGGLAQMKPEVLDYIDADGIAKHTAKILNVPEMAITDDEVVQQQRQQRAEQQAQQQQLETGIGMADIASKIGGGQGAQ